MDRGVPSDVTVASAVSDAALFPRSVWGSPRAYVVATIAGVVGLGNLWRFPYMAGRHGGGAFLVAYLVCLVVVAIPLAAVESAAGSLGRRSPVGTFRRAAGRWGGVVGWMVVATTVVILSYYYVVTGWTLGYAVDSLRGRLEPFDEFTTGHASLWLMVIVAIVVLGVLVAGVRAVQYASLLIVPLLVLIVVGLAIYAQTMAGAPGARGFHFDLRAEAIGDLATWRAAAGQAFYSIGVGQGMLIAYGSFVPAGTNLVRSTALIALTNAAVSVVAGAMVFAVVFTFGISPAVGSELSFTAFPQAFAEMPGGDVLAVAFFLLLFVAGFSSCVGAALVVVSAVCDELRVDQRVAAGLTTGAVVLLGVPSALSFTGSGLEVGGVAFLDRVDQVTGSGVVVVLGLAGAAILARGLPRRALTAAFGADRVSVGTLRLDPGRVVIVWAVLLLPIALLILVGGLLVRWAG